MPTPSTGCNKEFGTEPANIDAAEQQIDFRFTPSFRAWLLENSGLCVGEIQVFPVADQRRAWERNTIIEEFAAGQWFPEALEDDGNDYSHLLPFAQPHENWYCFDYSRRRGDGEVPVVHFQHDSGEKMDREGTFIEFLARLTAGEFEDD